MNQIIRKNAAHGFFGFTQVCFFAGYYFIAPEIARA